MALIPPMPTGPGLPGAALPFPITAPPLDYEMPTPVPEPERLPVGHIRVRYGDLQSCCVSWALTNAPYIGLRAGEANFLVCDVTACHTVMQWARGAWEKAPKEFQGWRY